MSHFNSHCFFWLLHYAIDDVDTRAITRRLRQDGSLIGVLSTEDSKTDEELLEISRSWDIVGKQLIFGVCEFCTKFVLIFPGLFFQVLI